MRRAPFPASSGSAASGGPPRPSNGCGCWCVSCPSAHVAFEVVVARVLADHHALVDLPARLDHHRAAVHANDAPVDVNRRPKLTPRIASSRMLLNKFSPMTGAGSPNQAGGADGETDQHGRTARGGVGGGGALRRGGTA